MAAQIWPTRDSPISGPRRGHHGPRRGCPDRRHELVQSARMDADSPISGASSRAPRARIEAVRIGDMSSSNQLGWEADRRNRMVRHHRPRFTLLFQETYPSFFIEMYVCYNISPRLPAAGLPRFEMRTSAKREEEAWPLLTDRIPGCERCHGRDLFRWQTDRATIQDLYRTWICRHRTQQCRAGADGVSAAVAGRESRR